MSPKDKREWDAENTLIFSIKFFTTSEKDLLDFMDEYVRREAGAKYRGKIGKGTILKRALRMYLESEIKNGNYKQEENT